MTSLLPRPRAPYPDAPGKEKDNVTRHPAEAVAQPLRAEDESELQRANDCVSTSEFNPHWAQVQLGLNLLLWLIVIVVVEWIW